MLAITSLYEQETGRGSNPRLALETAGLFRCLHLDFQRKVKDFVAGKEHFVKEVKTVAAALKFGAVWNQSHRDNTIASSQLSYRP